MNRTGSAAGHESEIVTDINFDGFGNYKGRWEIYALPANISQQMTAEKNSWVNISWAVNLRELGDLAGIRLIKSLANSMTAEIKLIESDNYTNYFTALQDFVSIVTSGQENISDELSIAITLMNQQEIDHFPKSVQEMAIGLSNTLANLSFPSSDRWENAKQSSLAIARALLEVLTEMQARGEMVNKIRQKWNEYSKSLELLDYYPYQFPLYGRLLEQLEKLQMSRSNLPLLQEVMCLKNLKQVEIFEAGDLSNLNDLPRNKSVTTLVINGATSFSSFSGMSNLAAIQAVSLFGVASEIDMMPLWDAPRLRRVEIVHDATQAEIAMIFAGNQERLLDSVAGLPQNRTDHFTLSCTLIGQPPLDYEPRMRDLFFAPTSSTASGGECTNSDMFIQDLQAFGEVDNGAGQRGGRDRPAEAGLLGMLLPPQ